MVQHMPASIAKCSGVLPKFAKPFHQESHAIATGEDEPIVRSKSADGLVKSFKTLRSFDFNSRLNQDVCAELFELPLEFLRLIFRPSDQNGFAK